MDNPNHKIFYIENSEEKRFMLALKSGITQSSISYTKGRTGKYMQT